MTTSIKITSLTNIGGNIAYTTLVPVVNMTGTPETQKANLQIVGNLILNGAGGANFARAAQANIALSVANANQPNITSIGNLNNVAISGNLLANGFILANGNVQADYFIGNGSQLTGLSLLQGLQGTTGATGAQGTAGSVGIQGTTGSIGIQGTTGAQGIQSTQGLQGLQGLSGGGGTGNITFNNINIIGTGNLNLQPDPANSGSYLDIFLSSGPDIHIVASASANLILGKDDQSNVMTSWDGNVYIQSWDNNSNTQGGVWTFGGDGNFTITSGGAIKSGNLSIASSNGIGTIASIIEDNGLLNIFGSGNGACVAIGWQSDYSNGAGDTTKIYFNPAGNGGNIIVTTGNTSSTLYDWNFDSTGNLTLPGGGTIYGNPFTPSGAPGNTITLQPAGSGTITDQRLLIYPTAGDGDHIHMVTGNLYQTELFMGSDNFFAKLANTGNFVVQTNDNAGNVAIYTFGTDGNLNLPGNLVGSGASPSPTISGFDSISLNGTGTVVNASAGNILTNEVTGTKFNFLNGSYTATITGGGATSNYSLNLPANAGSNGQILSTDGAGNLSWVAAGSGSYGNSNVATFLASYGSNTITTTGNVTTGNLNAIQAVFNNGDSVATTTANQTQIAFAYQSSPTLGWNQYITTQHNGGNGANNTIQFWTSDGSQFGTFPANAILGLTVTNGNIATGGISASANVLSNGYARFSGTFDESQASNAGLYLGYAGGTPRMMFGTGNTSQTFEIDNDGGNLRFYQPGSTKATLTSAGNFSVSGSLSGTTLISTNSQANEGGEISLALPSSGSTLSGNIIIDSYIDRVRIFEGGGTSRGAYIDLSQAAAGVGTLLNNRVSGLVNAGTFVTMDLLKATVTTSGNRGLSLASTTGSFNILIGGTYAVSGGTGGSSGTTTVTTTAGTSQFNWNFTASGDISTYIITDTTNSRAYRITLQINASYNNNLISIERLV